MMDYILNIITWALITAGFLVLVGIFGLCLFVIVEKMNDQR
jgi:hypothetical protein